MLFCSMKNINENHQQFGKLVSGFPGGVFVAFQVSGNLEGTNDKPGSFLIPNKLMNDQLLYLAECSSILCSSGVMRKETLV